MSEIPIDKRNHFIAGFLLSISGIVFPWLCCLGFLYGIGKEVWDKYHNGTVEFADLVATWFGAGIATLAVIMLRNI